MQHPAFPAALRETLLPRVAKPAAIKKLHGSDQPRDEPVAYGDLVEHNAAPKDLTPLQREIWEFTLTHAPRGVLKRIDTIVLRAWCVHAAMHQIATEQVNALGDDLMVETPSGALVQSPYLGILNRQSVIVERFANLFGFTPVARARLGAAGSSNAIAAEALLKPVYGKEGGLEQSLEDYLEAAPRTRH